VTDRTPRSAALLLSDALTHLDVIQPPALRDPVRDILRAGIELCASSPSLLGKPIEHTLRLAQAVVDTASRPQPRRSVFDTSDQEAYWHSRNNRE
jgi:hypothetical protein